jgi:uncharacterized BrkB/YihY/UPF0761 family membrane protein
VRLMRPGSPPSAQRRTWDVVVSVAALVVAAVIIATGVLVGVYALAFLDSCYAPRCSESAAWTAVVAPLVAADVVGLAGMAATIVRLSRRRPAWPFALGTLVVAVIVLAAGAVGYSVAVG